MVYIRAGASVFGMIFNKLGGITLLRFVVYTLHWILFGGLCLFTLFASLPLQEDLALAEGIRFDPEGAGLRLLNAWLAFFCGALFLLFAWRKKRGKTWLVITVLCLLISGYRILSIGQYHDPCQYVESSVCVIEYKKALPMW
jgi:hypothetical protein